MELKTGSEKGQNLADIIIFKDKEYEVFEVEEWLSATGRNDYYKAIMIRRDVLHGSR